MKILLINKFHYMRGGSETYYFAQAEALRAKKHEVICFAMEDEKNLPCEQSKYFLPNVDYNNGGGVRAKINAVTSFFYSKTAADKMEALIEAEHPDIAHIGLLHRQITFSVVEVLKKHNIPIVMTMHDLIFACPNYTMLTNGEVCEECVEGNVFNCVKKKCVKGSTAKSLLAACEKEYLLRKKYYNLIDLYITECNHYKKLMDRSDVTKSRIITMSNFLPINQMYEFNPNYQDYVLYFGRFSCEKGIFTLLRAHKERGCKHKLVLVGAGPLQTEIEEYIKKNNLTNIEMPGATYGEKMDRIIEGAKVIIIPSEWYENCPYALLQSIAKGKIVIASNIGGLPELIENGRTGYLFEAGNSEDLASHIDMVMNMSKEDYESMSRLISIEAGKKHHWEQYTDRLVNEYSQLISRYQKVDKEKRDKENG